jgi:hypothetical protein
MSTCQTAKQELRRATARRVPEKFHSLSAIDHALGRLSPTQVLLSIGIQGLFPADFMRLPVNWGDLAVDEFSAHSSHLIALVPAAVRTRGYYHRSNPPSL